MKYQNIRKGIFLQRPNRFLARVAVDAKEELCHVKNTGRLGELLLPGAAVWVQEHDNPNRKTRFSLIAVEKDGVCYSIDSQAPNILAREWLASGKAFPGSRITDIHPEQKYGNSRFDLAFCQDGKRAFMEVKGVTLNQNGTGLFPDAPTLRGVKHVRELIECQKEDYEAYVLFVVKFETAERFMPNIARQPEFAAALLEAEEAARAERRGCWAAWREPEEPREQAVAGEMECTVTCVETGNAWKDALYPPLPAGAE